VGTFYSYTPDGVSHQTPRGCCPSENGSNGPLAPADGLYLNAHFVPLRHNCHNLPPSSPSCPPLLPTRRPAEFPFDLWQLALLVPGKTPITAKSPHRKYKEEVCKPFNNYFALCWPSTPIGSGKVKWDKIAAMLAEVTERFKDQKTFSLKARWAWINFGPAGCDLKAFRPSVYGTGPPNTTSQIARRGIQVLQTNTSEMIEASLVGRKELRRRLNPKSEPPAPTQDGYSKLEA
jgi:hypothetical protein